MCSFLGGGEGQVLLCHKEWMPCWDCTEKNPSKDHIWGKKNKKKSFIFHHPQEMKEQGEKRKRPKAGEGDEDDTEQASGVRKKVKGGRGGMKKGGKGAWRGGR